MAAEPNVLKLSRRGFLLSLGSCGTLAALGVGLSAASRHWVSAAELRSFTQTSWALGTDVALTVLHSDERVAKQALKAAFEKLDEVESVLSLYRTDSQISRLNAAGRLEQPHPHLLTVLEASRRKSQLSGGAFDVSVGPLWDLYFASKQAGRLPSAGEIQAVRERVDYRRIEFSADHVSLQPGMKLTFNGIAQGYAADCVMEILKAHGIAHALADTGEFLGAGRRADGSPFKVGIQHPRHPAECIALCSLDGRALATSGDYATCFSDDFLYNHIFDPATGRSPSEFSSVSVMAPAGIIADGLSTAVFVLGRGRALRLLETLPDCDAFFVTKEGATFKTANFPIEGPRT